MQKKILSYVLIYLRILGGTAIYALGFQLFCYSNNIVSGGVTGIAMIINRLTTLPVGVTTIVLNIPLFIFSWRKFGLNFLIGSLVGMLSLSVFIDLFSLTGLVFTDDVLLGAVFGGILKGLGLGLVYSANATTGGVDIVAKFLRRKYQHINFGTFLLLLDVAVIVAFALIFHRYESGMYSVISMYLSSQMIDLVLYGAVNSKVCYVITDESARVKDAITHKLHRGVTYLHGEGAWSGVEKDIILCVIKQSQIVELKKLVRESDENAFMIVSDSREVFGKGFTYIGDES